jgi:hypothetical protein
MNRGAGLGRRRLLFTLRLKHDPEKWMPVPRLREASFGGRRNVGKSHAQIKS